MKEFLNVLVNGLMKKLIICRKDKGFNILFNIRKTLLMLPIVILTIKQNKKKV